MTDFDNTASDNLRDDLDWSPINKSGANFKAHKLVKKSYNFICFKPTLGAYLFYSIFLIVGAAMLVYSFVHTFPESESENQILLPIVGAVFFLVGAFLIISSARGIIFDNKAGIFWKGKKPDRKQIKAYGENWTYLDEVVAVQMLSEYERGSNSSYYSYEINLVLKDGHRINVVDHGSEKAAEADAATVATFLGVPFYKRSGSEHRKLSLSETKNLIKFAIDEAKRK